jgi:hypothetical protein
MKDSEWEIVKSSLQKERVVSPLGPNEEDIYSITLKPRGALPGKGQYYFARVLVGPVDFTDEKETLQELRKFIEKELDGKEFEIMSFYQGN